MKVFTFEELKELVKDKTQNYVWVENKIYLHEKEGLITYSQREELLNLLAQ